MPADVECTDGGIVITIRSRVGETIKGWEEAREDLGLNKHGEPVAGIKLVHEEPHYWDEDDEYPHGYGPVTLRVPTLDALKHARKHLYDRATERFEWGADGEAIHDFLNVLPTRSDAKQQLGGDE